MIDIIRLVIGILIGIFFGLFFLSPLFVFCMSLNFNKLTKFGVLIYFNFIFVSLLTYLPLLFNEKIFENVGLGFQIICGISYLILIVFVVINFIPEKYSPKIYIKEKAEK